ncbi:MAG: 2-phosphosulfolactate phosphatase [Candidatus Coatesbacteria bacterium]|nr:2-phosphosulfolactate phosphatase [Candidatus Coatesbacteria bacterium]
MMEPTPRIDAALCPAELAGLELSGRTAVVIDVLRATTTITTALEAGAAALIPRATLEECRARRREDPELLCGGERGGLKPADFELGNSPAAYTASAVRGRRIVFSTTNGTRALLACAAAETVLLGALINRAAVAGRLAADGRDVVLVCSAKHGRPNLEDSLCAGLIVRALEERGLELELSDGARLVRAVAATYPPGYDVLADTDHGREMLSLDLEADIRFCARLDTCRTVGRWTAGRIIV